MEPLKRVDTRNGLRGEGKREDPLGRVRSSELTSTTEVGSEEVRVFRLKYKAESYPNLKTGDRTYLRHRETEEPIGHSSISVL